MAGKSWTLYSIFGGRSTWRLAPEDLPIDASGFVWRAPAGEPPDEDQVRVCADILRGLRVTKTSGLYSYSAKHRVESAVGQYVSNGALIEAARRVGVPIACSDGNPNGFLFVDRRDFRRRLQEAISGRNHSE
jgi:hypothetical protein